MKLPAEGSSSWVHIAWSAFTWASLKAWSEFSDLPEQSRRNLAAMATSLRGFIDALLKEARETQDQTLFGRPVAQAQQNAWLTLLRRRIVEVLGIVVAKLGGGSDNHPVVREFLPRLAGGITREPLADRPRLTRQAADRLAGLGPALTDKATLVARLKEAADGAESAIKAADTAWAAWTTERSEDVVAKGRLRLELQRIHGLLNAEFPGQAAFVESFFLKGDRPSEGTTDEPEAPPPAPSGPTP